MEAAHASGLPPAATYADSVDSLSPHSRGGGDSSWDEPLPPLAAAKLRLMCSYGGQIVPRPHDRTLCYVGGETRIVAVDRHSTLDDLHARLSRSLLGGRPFSLKYQLPSEDLDSLISISTDEDLDNMVDEYDRIAAASKSARLRLFLFPASPSPSSSLENSLLHGSSKSDTWFVDALNGAMPLVAPNHSSIDSAASSVNCLLGLDGSYPGGGGGGAAPEFPAGKLGGGGGRQEVQSMPDSPMLETASSFGSASSAPSLSSLPPIRVRPEDDRGVDLSGLVDAAGILEDQFAQMNISGHQQKASAHLRATSPPPPPLDVEGFKHHLQHFPPPPPVALAAAEAAGEVPTGVFPSENPKPQQSEQQLNKQVLDNAASRSVYGQETPPNASDPKQQEPPFFDPGYGFRVMEQGYFLQPPSLPVRPMRAVEQLQQQAQQQQQQQQQQQGAVQHLAAAHHHATGAVLPIPSYYNQMLIHPQQQLPPVAAAHPYSSQVPLYLLPFHHGPAYNLAVQAKLGDAVAAAPFPSTGQPTIPPHSSVLPPLVAHKQEVPTNIYRTAVGAAPALSQPPPPTKLINLDPSRQYVGYHPLNHPTSQPAAVSAGYGYEYVDPVHAYQMYYAPAASAALPPQYQMMSAGAVTAEPPIALQQPTDANRTGAS